MATKVNVYWSDAEAEPTLENTPFYFDDAFTLAEIQAWINLNLIEFDQAVGVKVDSITAEYVLDIPAALKDDPVALYTNERGGLISFNTSGASPEAHRLPGILFSVMPGKEFSTLADPIDDIVTVMTTETTAANMRPLTKEGFDFLNARYGKKSRRK